MGTMLTLLKCSALRRLYCISIKNIQISSSNDIKNITRLIKIPSGNMDIASSQDFKINQQQS